MSLNDEQNAAWDALYARAYRGPAGDVTPPPDASRMTPKQTNEWLYGHAGRSLQIVPPEPAPSKLAQIYDLPLSPRLKRQRGL